MRAFFSLEYSARGQASPSVSTRSVCESILFVRLETLRGSERRVVRIVGMVGHTLDETRFSQSTNVGCVAAAISTSLSRCITCQDVCVQQSHATKRLLP